jgi:hypothetical protein
MAPSLFRSGTSARTTCQKDLLDAAASCPKTPSAALTRRARKTSCCAVSDADLAAPYNKRDVQKHEALCRALGSHHGITLSLADFFSKYNDDEGEALCFANAISLAPVHADSRLLVATCLYVLAHEKAPGEFPAFDIAPETVEFI